MAQEKLRRGRGKHRRARACGTKEPMSRQAATNRAYALTKKQGEKVNAYRCSFCYLPGGARAWHVGHAKTLVRRLGGGRRYSRR